MMLNQRRFKRSLVLSLLSLLIALSVTACGAVSTDPEASLEAARAFMAARAEKDPGAIYDLLTEEARSAFTANDVIAKTANKTVHYESLGQPTGRAAGWAQVPVLGLTEETAQEITYWPVVQLTLQHDGRRWRVAWSEPLVDQAIQAYGRSAYSSQLEIGQAISAIDPYHFRGYLEQHFALRGLQRLREAEIWLNRAREYASAVERPIVLDAAARFFLATGNPTDALDAARQALNLASPYIPTTYSRRWQVDTMVVTARAHLALGDRKAAEDLISQAVGLDPTNGSLAILRWQLANQAPPDTSSGTPPNQP